MSAKTSKFYHIGLSLASSSAHASSVCVLDKSKKIVFLDKLYFTDDIRFFFENSVYVKNAIAIAGLTPDESLLEGKWRIHSKNYKSIEGKFEINRNNWTKRFNDRLQDYLYTLNETRLTIYRCNLYILRQSYGLKPDYPEKTSLDCKNFQAGLKIKYGFRSMPENILPAASLEAILYAMFGYDIAQKEIECKEIANFHGLKVLNPMWL